MKLIAYFLSILLIVSLSSCGFDSEEACAFVPLSPPVVNVKWSSLEDQLPNISSKQEMVDYFADHIAQRDFFFNRGAFPDDSIFIKSLHSRFTHPAVDTLLMETKKVFGDGTELKQEFNQAFSNVKYYYSGFEPPKVETVITGLESDLFVSDTLIIVGLDYFLGKKAKYRPNMYEYMLRRYEKDFVVPSAMLLLGIDQRINETNLQDKTVLADMITYGKAFYFAKQMLPCVPDSIFIGYTKKEIDGAFANQDLIWKRLVEDEVFFDTSQRIKQKYISERPKTIEVGEDCPGRIGMWVGWQIVKEYMKRNPDVTLPQLMRTADAQKIFKGSKYKPESR